MNETQTKIWDFLCTLSGEEVARLFTNYHGNQILDERFLSYIEEEGYDVNEQY